MKTIYLYLKNQYLYILTAVVFIIAPFTACVTYLPEIPHTQYLFLIVLVLVKLLVFNDHHRKQKLKTRVTNELTKEMGKPPSTKIIFKRNQFYLLSRDITIMLTGLYLIIFSILFNRF